MIKKISVLLILSVIGLNCNAQHDNKRKEENKSKLNSTILSGLLGNQIVSDCVYCDNKRAFNGNCTCFASIPVGTCMGMNTGSGQSNSVKVSCSELTPQGIWTQINSNTFYCNYEGCPIEAYTAAFTTGGR